MTVAPSRSNTLPHYPQILRALNTCLHLARQTRCDRIASLSFPLPAIDPLAVLLTVADTEQRQCYLESPVRGQAIAAWGEVISADFSGRDRFRAAQEYLTTWQTRVKSFSDVQEGPYFFCSFSFFDTLTGATEGFAPATVLLTRWQVVRHRQRYTLIANVRIHGRTMVPPLARAIAEEIGRLYSLAPTKLFQEPRSRTAGQLHLQLSPPEAENFQHKVRQTLSDIQTSPLQKQVVAHALDIQREQAFRRAIALPRLRSQHPDCYVFSMAGTQASHFIGASPERLLSVRQGRLVTDALAGSAPRGKTPVEDTQIGQHLLSNHKEQREHQLVLDFIVAQLQSKGLSPRYSTPPGLLRLSHIQHLHTPICADLPGHISPLSLVEALHPTPAVAGVPTAMACESIRRGESCDRGLYAAPFGWVDPYGNSEFIVGIRSALIRGTQARLYAGAGIVAGSDPQKELAEIQLKLQALAEALG